MRRRILSVSIHDCEVQHFRSGGSGGQNQNKRDTGVRVIHHPSGARGESREERSQLGNKKTAFRRMAESLRFQTWARALAARPPPLDEVVDKMMTEVKIEHKVEGKWADVA